MQFYFEHERMDVYQLARRYNRWLAALLERVPRGRFESRDNLKRAARSISRNLAEGAGKWSIADKINFYQISRGSATESAAGLDELVDLAGLPDHDVREGKEMLARVAAMLTGLVRSLEQADRRSSGGRRSAKTAAAAGPRP